MNSAKESKKDLNGSEARICADVPPPAWHEPDDSVFYSQMDRSKPDSDFLRKHFFHEGRLKIEQALFILERGIEILSAEATLLEIGAPVNVCGDIHGQYYDLMKLFEVGGPPSSTKYLFLGDYVDRGYFSVECFLYLLSLKINYPNNIYMLRGNHECKHLASHFTFKMECKYKYNDKVFQKSLQAFNSLPLAAVVNKQFFCVHGGISPLLGTLDDVRKIDRFREPPSQGLMCDLLWADPGDTFGNETHQMLFVPNRTRGCSFIYSYNAVTAFLERNNLIGVIRAHEAQEAGYRMYKKTSSGFPAVITMFSAPNYLDVYNNKAAILKYDGAVLNVTQFSHSPHPFWLPNFMDVFTWSVPFIGEKITEALLSILNLSTTSEKLDHSLSEEEKLELEKEKKQRKQIVQTKVTAISKVSRLFSILREERETIVELKKALGKETLPPGTLALGLEEAKKNISTFQEAREYDIENEHLPPSLGDEPRGLTMLTSPSLTSITSDSIESLSLDEMAAD